MIQRRALLNNAVVIGGATLLTGAQQLTADDPQRPTEIIDTNVSLFQWPFRRLPLDTTRLLVKKLQSLGVSQAWAGSFEGILHRDVTSVNERLANECAERKQLVPIGSINPAVPGWQQDLKLCSIKHRMPGIRIHPSYHGYTLDDPCCIQLVQQATSAGQFVQIAAKLEDRRTQHPLLHVQHVDLEKLPALIEKCPDAKIQLLNDHPRGQLLNQLAKLERVYFDVSRVEGTDGIFQLLESIPSSRVMFGSHAPFLIPEAALIRVKESDLTDAQIHSLVSTNATNLF